jgi:ElaB/YqjD/DUF883 family membrane-anchored ribosome-binding protein
MGEGPKDLRDEAVDPRLRNEGFAGPTGDDVTGRPLTGLDHPGASEAVGYAGGYAPAVPPSMTGDTTTSGDTASIRADIEQTRANISETVDAIQQKLSPSAVMSQAAGDVTDAARQRMRQVADVSRQAATRVADTTRQVSNRAAHVARENPWATAAAVAGVGALAWWLTSRRRADDDYDYDDYEDDILADVREESLYYEDDDTKEGRGLMRTMRNGALPLVVAGAGVGWWLWTRQSKGRATDTFGDYEGVDRSWNETEEYGAEAGSYRSFEGGRDWTGSPEGTGRRLKRAVSSAADRARGAVADAGERAKGMVSNAGERARDVMADAGDRARHVVDDVGVRTRQYAHRASSQVGEAGRQAGSQLSYWMDRNPLAVGAAAMAIGAAVGLALPESRKEQELIGPARDRLFDRAQSMAGDAVDRAKQTVQEVASKASDAMNQAGQGNVSTSAQPANDAGLGKNPR